MPTPSGDVNRAIERYTSLTPNGQSTTFRSLRGLVDLAEQSLAGPQVMLAITDQNGTWRWIGGEHLDILAVCRDRLIVGIQGFDIPPGDDAPNTADPDVVSDLLVLSPDQPKLRWIAARIQDRGALIACEAEPWEPNERVTEILVGFARLIDAELQRVLTPGSQSEPDQHHQFQDLIVHSARDGVIGIDTDGHCRFINETGATLLGDDPESLSEINVQDWFELNNPRDDLMQFRSGTPVEIHDATVHRADGSTLPVELAVLPNIGQSGEVIGAVLRFSDLTDRRAAFVAARDSEARHQAFLEMTLDSIVTVDRERRIIEFNQAAQETFRCAADDVIGTDISESLLPDTWQDWFNSAFEIFADSGDGPLNGRRVQINARRSDGATFPAEITITRLPAHDGWIFTLYIHDLSEHWWNERRRLTRYAVTRVLADIETPADALPEVVEAMCEGLQWDWAAVWTREPGSSLMRIEMSWHGEGINSQALEIVSRQKPFEPGLGLLGEIWTSRESKWIEDLNHAPTYRRAEAALACGFRSLAAMPIIGRQEVIGMVEFHSQRQREADAEMLRMMNSLGSQIGQFIERKQVEEERVQILAREQQARAEAEVAERRLAFLAEASAQLSTSLDYEVTLANVARLAVPKLADYCAIDMLHENGEVRSLEIADVDPEKEEIGRQLANTYPIDQDSDHPVAQVLRTARPVLYPEVTEDILRLYSYGDDNYFRILKELGVDSAMYVPLVARGRTIGVISFVASESEHQYGPSDLALAQELTRRAALAIDNARLYREAQDAVRVREEFLSIASHELKTPLTTVKGYSQILSRLLRRPSIDQERLTRLADQLQDQLGRFETLIADLLDISRIQQGGLELRPEDTDLVALTRTVAGRFEYPSDPEATHSFAIHAPDSYHGFWDPGRIDQVLTNLISNAVKYSPDGGEITIRIEPGVDDQVLLSVSDQGIGIPVDEQSQLFRPFARSETVQRAISGVGLGLYISHQIVDRHGGSIWIDSEPGQGATFIIRLPREYPGRRPEGFEDQSPTGAEG